LVLAGPDRSPSVTTIGASLALLAVYRAKVEPVDNVMRDIAWTTLMSLASIFGFVQAFSKPACCQGRRFSSMRGSVGN
jgi:hypothetical protein